MLIKELDREIRAIYPFDICEKSDPGLNGLQVGRLDKEVLKAVFAVDASLAAIERAASMGADVLIVHHGLFWYAPSPLTGAMYERVKALVNADMGLYAIHLPMDLHKDLGHSAVWASLLGLENIADAFVYKGIKLGLTGVLPRELSLEGVFEKMGVRRSEALCVWPFGKQAIRTVGILSGGGIREALAAARQDVDLFITGDTSHEQYFLCQEEKLNVISLGHYLSEIPGLKSLSEVFRSRFQLETGFIEMPTRL
jgi:dinuclear metal center YbgI/SA1388 family protein